MPNTPTVAPTTVVVPPAGSGADAVALGGMKGGGIAATALPLNGAGRKTRRLSKKALKMLKAMPKAKLLKLAGKKGGVDPTMTAGGKKKGSRKTKRRSGLLY
jgi:hypothetical protein